MTTRVRARFERVSHGAFSFLCRQPSDRGAWIAPDPKLREQIDVDREYEVEVTRLSQNGRVRYVHVVRPTFLMEMEEVALLNPLVQRAIDTGDFTVAVDPETYDKLVWIEVANRWLRFVLFRFGSVSWLSQPMIGSMPLKRPRISNKVYEAFETLRKDLLHFRREAIELSSNARKLKAEARLLGMEYYVPKWLLAPIFPAGRDGYEAFLRNGSEILDNLEFHLDARRRADAVAPGFLREMHEIRKNALRFYRVVQERRYTLTRWKRARLAEIVRTAPDDIPSTDLPAKVALARQFLAEAQVEYDSRARSKSRSLRYGG